MLKAFTPVSILLLSFAFKLKEPSQKLFVIVLCISIGVTIASYGEADFDLIGFLVQVPFSSRRVRAGSELDIDEMSLDRHWRLPLNQVESSWFRLYYKKVD